MSLGIRPGSFRATAQPFVKAAAMRGVSSSAITGILREEFGQAYRRTDLLSDLRYYRDVEVRADRFRSVRKDFAPTDRLFSEGHIRRGEANYRFVAKVTLRDARGQESEEFVTTLYRDRHTRGDVEQDLAEVARKYPLRAEWELVDVEVVELYRRV